MTAQLLGTFILFGKLWALMYALVILCVVLGALAVAWPNKRKPIKRPD